MPCYDYSCPHCGMFDAVRPMAERNNSIHCPSCQQPALRVLLNAPRLGLLTSQTRLAMGRNERAAHQPRAFSVGQDVAPKLRHPAACGCCNAKSANSNSAQPATAVKSFAGKRPWMISH